MVVTATVLPRGAFSTPANALDFDMTVAADGSGDYLTVQEAIDAAPNGSSEETIIFIKNGTYQEKILVPGNKTHLTLLGEDVDSTIIVWDDYSGKVVDGTTLGTSTSYTFQADPDYFKLENLTIENNAGEVGQAVALLVNGDKVILHHCKLIGDQDTYYTKGYGRLYMKNCYIEGTTDYIFGRSVAVFDSCKVVSKKSSYITAASTEEGYSFGYVFLDCELTYLPGGLGTFLGRPWRPYARTVFLRTYMDRHIQGAGWSEWSGNNNHETCFYAEYACVGSRARRTYRVDWSHELTEQEAADYTIANIFAQTTAPNYSDDWMPQLDSLPYERFVTFNVAGIEDLQEQIQLKVYPNPAQSRLEVSFHLEEASEVTLRITDLQGRVVQEYPWAFVTAGTRTLAFDLPELAAGQYQYVLQVGENQVSNSLIITK